MRFGLQVGGGTSRSSVVGLALLLQPVAATADVNKGSVQGPTLAEKVAGGMLLS